MIARLPTILERIAERRSHLKMTQHSVAKLAGITQSYLSAVEKGNIDVRLSTLQDIARALGLELVLVPAEALDSVQSIVGQGSPRNERRLFSLEPD